MKRLANLLTFFVAMFIFMFFYQNTSLNHYNSVVGLESSFAETTGKDYVSIEYNLYDDEGNDVFQKLVDFLEEFNYDAMSFTRNRRYDFIIDTTVYLHTENNLNDLDFFKSVNGKNIDFTLDNNSYYSSFINDKEATDIIDFINNSYHKEYQPKLTIKQFKSMLRDNPEKRTAIIFLYSDEKSNLIRDIENSEISNYIVSDDSTFIYELAKPEVLNIDAIKILLLLSISSLIVISICDLIGEKKEITIRKLFGEKNSSIYFNLIARRYLFNLILYIMTQILLYIVIIRGIRPIHILLLKPLLFAFGLYLTFWIFANLVSYFVLTKVGKATNLKQNNTVRFTNSITLIIKVILVVLMITPFINLFTLAPLTIEENIILRKNKTKMKNNLAIEGIFLDSEDYSLDEWEPLKLTLEFLEDLNWVYRDFSANYLPEELKQEIPEEVFGQQYVQHPYIVANDTYLKDYDIRDLDGNSIDLKSLENNTLLVPETYKNDEFTDVYYDDGQCTNIIYIQDGGIFYNYYPLVPDIEVLRQHNPVILFKNKLDANMEWNGTSLSIRDEEDTREKIDDFLVNNELDNIVHITSMDNVYDTTMARSNDQVFNFILTLCLYILMIFIFQYQTVFVYFSENKDEIAVNYLFGKTYMQRYGLLILNSIIVYFVPLSIGIGFLKIHYKFMLMYVLFGIILDFIVSTIMIRSFEKKKTLSVLKGE